MAQVASELSAVSPLRPLSASRSSLAASEDDAASTSVFANLLDSSDPSPEPPPRADRRDDAPPAPDRRDDPPPAKAATDTKPADPKAKDTTDRPDTKDGKVAADVQDTKNADKKSDAAKDAAATADALPAETIGDAAKVQADTLAAVIQPVVVATPPAPVIPIPELAGLAAIEAAGNAAGGQATPAGAKDAGDAKGAGKSAAKTPAVANATPASSSTTGATDAAASGDNAAGDNKQAAGPAASQAGAEHAAAKNAKPAGDPAQADAGGAVKTSAEVIQNLGLAAPTASANTASSQGVAVAANAASPANAAAVPIAGLAVEIVTQAHAGKNHFDIRLDPPELGRINVRLEVGHDGSVTSHVTVDRADTLDLLKRDAPQLERALQQAGLKMGDSAMQFSLRDQSFSRNDGGAQQHTAHLVVSEDDPAPLEALRQGYGRLLGLGGGLDIRV